MTTSKLNRLSTLLAQSLKDDSTAYNTDGNIYTATIRKDYIIRACEQLLRLGWNLFKADTIFDRIKLFGRVFPDMLAYKENATTTTTPTKVSLAQSGLYNCFQFISLIDEKASSKQWFTTIEPSYYHIIQTEKNNNYTYTTDRPACCVMNNIIYVFPTTYTITKANVFYVKSIVQSTDGGAVSYDGAEDIPFAEKWQMMILELARLLAYVDKGDIEISDYERKLHLIELDILRG